MSRARADGTLRTRHRFTDNVSGNPAGFGLASTLDLDETLIAPVEERAVVEQNVD